MLSNRLLKTLNTQSAADTNSKSSSSKVEAVGHNGTRHGQWLFVGIGVVVVVGLGIWSWLGTVTVSAFFNCIIAAATALVTWFNYQLVQVSREMRNAAADSAAAARQSAQAARKSLQSDRPYLVMESLELHDFFPVSQHPANYLSCTFRLKNYGRGPAVEVQAVMRLAVEDLTPRFRGEVVPAIDGSSNRPDKPWFVAVQNPVILPNATSEPIRVYLADLDPDSGHTKSDYFLNDETFHWLTIDSDSGPLDYILWLTLRGTVRYSDLLGNKYSLIIKCEYSPSRQAGVPGVFEQNQHAGNDDDA